MSDEGLPPRPRHLVKRPWCQIFKLVRPPLAVLHAPHLEETCSSSRCAGALCGWRAAAALIWRTEAQIKPNSKIPTARTGHSAPAKTASDPRVNGPGLWSPNNVLAATQTQMVVATHPHRYRFSITSILRLLRLVRHGGPAYCAAVVKTVRSCQIEIDSLCPRFDPQPHEFEPAGSQRHSIRSSFQLVAQRVESTAP
jgi:hypothetical protein